MRFCSANGGSGIRDWRIFFKETNFCTAPLAFSLNCACNTHIYWRIKGIYTLSEKCFKSATFLIANSLSFFMIIGLPIVPIIANIISLSSTDDLSLILSASSCEIYLTLLKSRYPLLIFLLVINGIPLSIYFGESWVPSLTSKTSLILTHSQLSGISNGFSSSVISGNCLVRLIFFSLIKRAFSSVIFSNSTLAGSSFGSCFTSLPSIAYWSNDCLSLSLNPSSSFLSLS